MPNTPEKKLLKAIYGSSKFKTPEGQTCSICQRKFDGWGNNAWPINEGRCCDRCNDLVISRRLKDIMQRDKENALRERNEAMARIAAKLSVVVLMYAALFPGKLEAKTLEQVNRQNEYQWRQFNDRLDRQRYEYDQRRQQRTLDQIERNTRR